MPIFENNGKKQNVQDAHVEKYMKLYPDATTIMEREGKKYRVKAKDYNTFLGDTLEAPKMESAPQLAPQQDVFQTQTEMAAPVRQPMPESEYLGKIGIKAPNTPVEGDIYRGEYGTYTRTEVPYKTKEYASLEDAKAGRELNIEVSDEEALERMRKDGESRAAERYTKPMQGMKTGEQQEYSMQGALNRAKQDMLPYVIAEEITTPLMEEFATRRNRKHATEYNEMEARNIQREAFGYNPETGKVEIEKDAYMRADDIELIEEYAKQARKRMLADDGLKAKAQEQADMLGMGLEEYVDAVAIPTLQERMWNEWVSPQEEDARRNYDAMSAMWDNSIIGMLDSHVGLFRPKPETKTDRYLKMVGQEEWSKNASLLERAGGFAGAMALDLPFFGSLGKLASVPAQYAGKQALKQMVARETQKMVARGVSEAAAKRYANYVVKNGLKNRILLNLSTAPLQSGLTFGMFDAGKAALNMSLNDEWSWKELGKSAAGGTLLGGALGVTGAVGSGLTHGLSGVAKVGAKVAEFGVENAVFTEGGRLIGKLHGEQPENGWLEDYVESGATLLMLKVPGIVKNMSRIKGNKEASEVFTFDKLEREQLGKYGKDLNAVLESMLPRNENVAVDGKGVSLDGINEGRLTEEYVRVMNDVEIPLTTKAKLMGIVEGKAMTPPRVVDAKAEGNRVLTYDPMGRLVEIKEYKNDAAANKELEKLQPAMDRNLIGVLEDMYIRIKGYEADDVTVREWLAKNPDVKAEDVATIVAKDNAGEPLTKAEQKVLDSMRQARREGLNDASHLNKIAAALEDAGINAKDVMTGIDKPMTERTETEQRAVNAYRNILIREVGDMFKETAPAGDVNGSKNPGTDIVMRTKESDRSVDETANDGMVYTTTTPSGEKIIITGGKVVLDNEGYIDVNQSEGLVAMFPDGQKKPVRPGDLREKVEVSNAEEMKAVKREEIEQEIAAEPIAESGEVAKNEVLTYEEGGETHSIEVLGDNGDGTSRIISDGQEKIIGNDLLESLRAQGVEAQKGENAEKVVESSPTGEAAAPVVEAPKTALEQIPRNEKNVPLYEQVDSELAWDGVVEEAGGNEETAMVAVNSMIADKQDALKKAEKAKAKAGVTIAEKIAAENERVANIERAKADLAKWQEIAGVKAKRALAAEAESKRVADEAAARLRAEEERLRAEREEAERAEREALNGVPDMVDDKPQDARARGYRRVNGHKVDRQEPVQGLMGKEIAVKFSDSSIPTGRVAVIEAEQLQPSHIQGQRNPLHFIDEAQPKERNDAASVLSARKIAENVRPEEITSSVTAYTGAPTVNARGEAVQGNNRSAALRLMWENNPEQAAKYKQYLMDHAAEFGLNAEEIAAMKSPVLVNMLDVSDADAITLGQYVAQDTESGGTERIKPKNVMQKMGGDMRSFANKLLASNNEEASFAELVDANGVEVLKWMAQKGYITPTQYKSAFDSKGNLTAEVKNDLRDVMYQSIFKGGSTQLEEMFNALPAKAQKAILATAFRDYDSPSGERMNGEVQNSIRAYYALARDAAFANAKNYKEAKEAAMMWARQYQLDDVSGESFLPLENFSNFAIELAVKFKGETQKTLQNLFNNIYDLIQGTKQASIFEEADNTPRTLKEAIKETFNIDYNGQYDSNSLAGGNKAGQPGRQGTAGSAATGERIEGGERPADSTGGTRGNGEVKPTVSQTGDNVAEGGNAPGMKRIPTTLQEIGNVVVERANKKQEERRRVPLRARAQEWAGKLGVPIKVHESIETVTNKTANERLKNGDILDAWFNVNTGEVEMYLPYVMDVAQVDKLYLHEVVGHKGLREVMGEKFDALCDNVWGTMSESKREHFLDYVGAVDEFGVVLESPSQKQMRDAADEYMAWLAENVDYETNKELWQPLIDSVREFFESLGMGAAEGEKGVSPFVMSDADIVDLIKASYANLASKASVSEPVEGNSGDENIMARKKSRMRPRRELLNTDLTEEEKSDIQKYIQKLSREIDDSHPLLFVKNNYIYTFNTDLELYDENRQDGDGFEILYKDDLNKLTYDQKYDIQRSLKNNPQIADRIIEQFGLLRSGNILSILLSPGTNTAIPDAGVDGSTNEEAISKRTRDIGESAFDESGEVNPQDSESGIRFRKGNPTLLGTHSITEDKLRKAIKMGGLANPSTAVFELGEEIPGEYGEITFVMPSSMVDKKTGRNTGAFAGDAWTPTYPQVERQMGKRGSARAREDVQSVPKEMQKEVRMGLDSWLDGREGAGLAYLFLQEEGLAPELSRVAQRYSDEIRNRVGEIAHGEPFYRLSPGQKQEIVDLYIEQYYNGDKAYYSNYLNEKLAMMQEKLVDVNAKSFIKRSIQQYIDGVNEYGFEYEAVSDFLNKVQRDIDHSGGVNDRATTQEAARVIREKGLEREFQLWKEELLDRYEIKEVIFKGFTPTGNRRYVPHTLENVSKDMKEQGRNGAVGLNASFNKFAAGLLKPLGSLDAIRKRKGNLRATHADTEAFRDKWGEVYYDLAEKLQPDAKGYEDYGLDRVAEAATKKDPKAFIKSEYGIELSEADEKALKDMVWAIQNEYPVMYFETKFERPVYLDEFAGVVIPENTGSDVVESLENAGLKIETYEPGNEKARAEAIKRLTEEDDRIMFRRANKNQDIFVSNAQRAVEGIKQEKATPEQWIAMLKKNGGLKAGEEAWLGLETWLNEKQGAVTKQEILDFIGENKIQIEEVGYAGGGEQMENYRGLLEKSKGKEFTDRFLRAFDIEYDEFGIFDEQEAIDLYNEANGTDMQLDKDGYWNDGDDMQTIIDWAESVLKDARGDAREIHRTRLQYTTEGLENKREIALVVPTVESYNIGDYTHFGDAGDGRAVAWVRFGETTDSEGNRVLVIDEIQSKRHQDGREKGYRSNADKFLKDNGIEVVETDTHFEFYKNGEIDKRFAKALFNTDIEKAKNLYVAGYEKTAIPSAPFEKNWHELAMKRMLRLAAEEGFDKVAWTTGEQQAERYNIAKVVSHIECEKVGKNGNKSFSMGLDYKFIVDPNGIVVSSKDEYIGKSIADIVGKPLANKMLEMQEGDTISGDGLRIGGEGMKGFYDRMLPSFVSKYTKKWGAKVGEVTMPNLRENNTMHSVDVTPEMQESVMEGQTMFRFIGKKGAENLDKAEEATTRLDNLNVAREMETAGKDAKSIKLATGWERGADGKWRYETEDAKVNRAAKLYNLETRESYPIARSIEIGRVDDNSTIRLTDLVKDDELFKAYPEMEKYFVSFEEMSANVKGEHDAENTMIRINKDDISELESTLVHEIQHAIQSAEGFAMGGSTETIDVIKDKARVWAWRNALKETEKEHPELAGTTELEKVLMDEYRTEGLEEYIPTEEQRIKGFNLYARGYDGEGYERAFYAMPNVVAGNGFATYRRLAGEVESRNVQERMGMTPEERRNKLAEETEDVRREDQVFLEENLGVSASEAAEEDIPVESVQTQPMTFAEKITNSVLEASAKNKENLALRSDALRMYGRDVANVLKLMGKQREYDKSTVDQLVKLAKMYFKDAQLLGGLTSHQVGRVMTRLNNAVGKRDITDDANKLVNILVDAHNKELEKMLEKQAKTKAKKVNASGVEVIGKLDKEGQLLLEEYNTGKELDLESIDEKIIDLQNEAADASGNVEGESGEPDAERTREVAARLRGLELARQYREEILAKKDEIKGLEQELKSAEQDAKDGAMDRAAYKEFRRATERAILESKLEMVDAYHGLIHGLGGDISSSAKRAKMFQQAQIDHVKEIQHNANSDLLGHPAEAQGETPDKWNSSVPRLFMSAMPTFQTMLKFFGEKAADGRGYLYERFIPQHTQASHNEYVGKTEAREKMRDKLTEIFAKKTSIEDFLDMSRKEGAALEYQEGGQKKTIELTRGQVLYLYMINKMADGQMKLSRMGITDADVLKMAKELPEEFLRFADWVQEDFLTELREKYNKVHERMFGAPMAAIESYFPIKINKRSRGEKIEPGMNAEDKPSTVTGSVIKRTKNAVAIDLSADAMQVLLGHIDDMENWAAWAEFRRDVKSLLNYRHFQNQVKGMESLRYGSGEKLWKNFVDVANIAAGSFKPSGSNVDKAARSIAKGFISSKIAFRYFTAVKQILSTPAFWSEVDFGKMMNAYLHQKEAWDWAMKNLPGFSKRWEGRASGNEILLESDADWKVWQNRAVQWLSKEGMRANAFIDALTVATGAKAVFETKYEMFKKAGYSEERAREKALNRAAEAYNESQQSSESAYLSPLQAEATWLSSMLAAYRNSPFGYNRKWASAMANLKKKIKKGFKQESIEYMTKQLMRDGLNEEKAKKFAKSTYRRSVARDAADVALYGFFLNFIWRLGPELINIFGGDDDEKKVEQLMEAVLGGLMSPVDQLPGGEAITGAVINAIMGEGLSYELPKAVAAQDMEALSTLLETDYVRAANEALNALVAMGVGVNPQTFTDMYVALSDVDGFDPREIAMLVLRLINAPNSKLELLEADEAMENYGANMEEVMKEYAEYQKSKRAPLTGWMYSDESEQKAIERYEKRFKKILDERFEVVVENTDEYDMWYENSDPQMKAKLAKLRQKFLEGDKETTMEKLDSIDVTKKVLFGSGYDEVNTVYYELSTAEDEDMAMMIDTKLKELQPMMDEYKKLRGDERKAYREENLEQIQFYNRLNTHKNNVNNLKGAMKKKPEEAQEKMEKIRKIRTKAIDLINNYNE